MEKKKLHHISRGTNTDSARHTLSDTRGVHSHGYTQDFSICNQAQRGELSPRPPPPPRPLCLASKFRPGHKKPNFSMTVEWRLLCRKRNQPKPPQVLMNYSGLGKDNDLSVFAGERGQAPGGPEGVTELQKKTEWINIAECQGSGTAQLIIKQKTLGHT